MSNAKYTPGPWLLKVDIDYPTKVSIEDATGYAVCLVDEGIEQSANAHIIVGAPEMLEALVAALPFLPKSSVADGGANKYVRAVQVADQVRAAIAKAKGEDQ